MIFTETKLDDSYPTTQLLINGFSKPFRLDRNRNGGGILVHVREDIPCKQLNNHSLPDSIEVIFVELNFRKSKWLLLGTYHPPSQNDNFYFENLGSALDTYNKYDKILIAGDLNAEDGEYTISDFLDLYDFKNLVKDKTCFKSLDNPSCVDLFITNCNRSFMHTKAISAGISDFHKMILTVLKTTFQKAKPREIIYRCYKHFDQNKFRDELGQKLLLLCNSDKGYDQFEIVILNILNKHAPLKKKVVRANEVPYMTKALRKAIANRSRLENRYYREKTDVSRIAYKKQKNYCSRLYKRERKRFYTNLDMRCITDSRKFWKTMKPFFSDKGLGKNNIILVEGNDVISDDVAVANILNAFFENAVTSLDLHIPTEYITDTTDISDPIEAIIVKYANHPSVTKIIEKCQGFEFSFNLASLKDIEFEINALNSKKSCMSDSIPAKIIKENSCVCSGPLLHVINKGIANSIFDEGLKKADLTPCHKDGATTVKTNYRPISLLPSVSKIFERVMEKQVSVYVDNFLSPFLCGYRKGFNAQYALLLLLEKWRISLDKQGYSGAILNHGSF